MINNTSQINAMVKDPVPKNVSKFPIHQTYLTDDVQPTGTGGYKFKAPEVWSSARSAKKSIAIRSIQWLPEPINLYFRVSIETTAASGEQPQVIESGFTYQQLVPINITLYDVLYDFVNEFNSWSSSNGKNLKLEYTYDNRTNTLRFMAKYAGASKKLRITDYSNTANPSSNFNKLLNQPLDYLPEFSYNLTYENVWDRSTPLNFHASFVPFDNYQYLGTIFDKWNEPIIYQDANSSPLFNVWITTDMKTPLKLLHESFIIRITFIIAVDSQYHS